MRSTVPQFVWLSHVPPTRCHFSVVPIDPRTDFPPSSGKVDFVWVIVCTFARYCGRCNNGGPQDDTPRVTPGHVGESCSQRSPRRPLGQQGTATWLNKHKWKTCWKELAAQHLTSIPPRRKNDTGHDSFFFGCWVWPCQSFVLCGSLGVACVACLLDCVFDRECHCVRKRTTFWTFADQPNPDTGLVHGPPDRLSGPLPGCGPPGWFAVPRLPVGQDWSVEHWPWRKHRKNAHTHTHTRHTRALADETHYCPSRRTGKPAPWDRTRRTESLAHWRERFAPPIGGERECAL